MGIVMLLASIAPFLWLNGGCILYGQAHSPNDELRLPLPASLGNGGDAQGVFGSKDPMGAYRHGCKCFPVCCKYQLWVYKYYSLC